MHWKSLMKYSELIPETNGKFEDMLDIMQELIPIKDRGDRTSTFIMWVAECRDQGLINGFEKMDLQHYLIHGYGGF